MKTMMLMLAVALLAGCGSGGDSAERVFADMSANLREMSAILISVVDEGSAKAALPRIDAVRAKMRDCARRARAVSMPDAATQERLDRTMLEVQREVMPAIIAAKERLAARPDLMAILAPSLQDMDGDL